MSSGCLAGGTVFTAYQWLSEPMHGGQAAKSAELSQSKDKMPANGPVKLFRAKSKALAKAVALKQLATDWL